MAYGDLAARGGGRFLENSSRAAVVEWVPLDNPSICLYSLQYNVCPNLFLLVFISKSHSLYSFYKIVIRPSTVTLLNQTAWTDKAASPFPPSFSTKTSIHYDYTQQCDYCTSVTSNWVVCVMLCCG